MMAIIEYATCVAHKRQDVSSMCPEYYGISTFCNFLFTVFARKITGLQKYCVFARKSTAFSHGKLPGHKKYSVFARKSTGSQKVLRFRTKKYCVFARKSTPFSHEKVLRFRTKNYRVTKVLSRNVDSKPYTLTKNSPPRSACVQRRSPKRFFWITVARSC